MECNRTLASHRLSFSSLSFSFSCSPLPPVLSLSLLFTVSFRSPPHATDASADFSLCPRALFLLRKIRAIATPEVSSRRYFRRAALSPLYCLPPPFPARTFISIYVAIFEILIRLAEARARGFAPRARLVETSFCLAIQIAITVIRRITGVLWLTALKRSRCAMHIAAETVI